MTFAGGTTWMTQMDASRNAGELRAAALQAIVDVLRRESHVQRCTLRLDRPGEIFPVVYEACEDGVTSLIGETTIVLTGQLVVEALRSGALQVIQDDSAAASDDPAFQRMLVAYGGLAAQIVTAVRAGDRLAGIVPLHALGAPRAWTADEARRAADACALIARVIA